MGILENSLFSKTYIPVALKSLKAANLRAKVAANNIANISTEGYKRKEVEFESILKEYISNNNISGKITDDKHIPIGVQNLEQVKPIVKTIDNDVNLSGKNNVDIDLEMAKLADAQMLHNFNIKFLASVYARFKTAITGNVR